MLFHMPFDLFLGSNWNVLQKSNQTLYLRWNIPAGLLNLYYSVFLSSSLFYIQMIFQLLESIEVDCSYFPVCFYTSDICKVTFFLPIYVQLHFWQHEGEREVVFSTQEILAALFISTCESQAELVVSNSASVTDKVSA